MLRHTAGLTRRDAILLLLGASSMHIWSLIFTPGIAPQQVAVQEQKEWDFTTTATVHLTKTVVKTQTQIDTTTATTTVTAVPTSLAIQPFAELPRTEVLAHAPGWTLFKNLYMSNGTMFIVADDKERETLPEIRLMASTPLEAVNTPENIAAREPTPQIMSVISPKEAKQRWVRSSGVGKGSNKVSTVEGNTFLCNDPKQFLRHYYHLVAELFFGVQAFWHGAFSPPVPASLDPSSPHFSKIHPTVPPIHRTIFAHANADGWRDDPGFNRYFLRAVLPSMTIEHEEDWQDRVQATRVQPGKPNSEERAFHFPMVLLADRSAAHRGPICGSQTQRTAAEAWDYMRVRNKLMGLHVGGWWAPLREKMWEFAGADAALTSLSAPPTQRKEQQPLQITEPTVIGTQEPTADEKAKAITVDSETQKLLPAPSKIVISYISRQSARHRKLLPADHKAMVEALQELVHYKNRERDDALEYLEKIGGDIDINRMHSVPPQWEFNELLAEKMTKDEQIQAAARSTFLLGVHGNGLTHLVFMDPNRYSTVIEIFFPQGFAHDYQWTSRALGMTHVAVWNDTIRTFANKPEVAYPEGFQNDEIPVHAPTISQIIQDRVAGKI